MAQVAWESPLEIRPLSGTRNDEEPAFQSQVRKQARCKEQPPLTPQPACTTDAERRPQNMTGIKQQGRVVCTCMCMCVHVRVSAHECTARVEEEVDPLSVGLPQPKQAVGVWLKVSRSFEIRA